MAQMTVFDDDELNKFFEFDLDRYAEDILNESAKIVEEKMKANARARIIHEGESEMINSIKASKPKKSRGAYILNVGPRGYSKVKVYRAKNGRGVRTGRTYSVSNALKAIWKEYGIPGVEDDRKNPHPFISTTVSQTERQVQELMQKRFEEKAKI